MNATFEKYFQNEKGEWYLFSNARDTFDSLENIKKRYPEVNNGYIQRQYNGKTKTEIKRQTFANDTFLVKYVIIWD